MRRITLLFLLIAIAPAFLLAQETAETSHVYLRDGSFLQGTVLDSDKDQLTLQTTYGEVLHIPQEAVKRVQEGNYALTYFPKGKTAKAKGLYGTFDFQLLVGQAFDNPWDDLPTFRAGFSANMGLGYQFSQLFSTGLDLGFTAYRNHLVASPAVEVRSYLMQGPWSPYLRLQGGYGFDLVGNPAPWEFGYTKGAMYYPALGFRFASRSNTEFHMDFGYKFQHLTTEDVWFTEKEVFRRFSLRCGIKF
ncbi:MAG: hypothetical protein GYB31_20500 [Bacteroidetes bacterium]|nr:hypothetical protein [Bacteroidota bacterium]